MLQGGLHADNEIPITEISDAQKDDYSYIHGINV
jgi:hypothetical protein